MLFFVLSLAFSYSAVAQKSKVTIELKNTLNYTIHLFDLKTNKKTNIFLISKNAERSIYQIDLKIKKQKDTT
jgi:hypothetical protein